MKEKKYTCISLDKLLVDEVRKNLSWRYSSITDFIRQATIEKLDKTMKK